MATAGDDGMPLFCGDAIADPLTGMHAALAALFHWTLGEAVLLDVPLHDVTAHCLSLGVTQPRAVVRRSPAFEGGWEVSVGGESQGVAPPRARVASTHAARPGADTRRVLESLAIPC